MKDLLGKANNTKAKDSAVLSYLMGETTEVLELGNNVTSLHFMMVDLSVS